MSASKFSDTSPEQARNKAQAVRNSVDISPGAVGGVRLGWARSGWVQLGCGRAWSRRVGLGLAWSRPAWCGPIPPRTDTPPDPVPPRRASPRAARPRRVRSRRANPAPLRPGQIGPARTPPARHPSLSCRSPALAPPRLDSHKPPHFFQNSVRPTPPPCIQNPPGISFGTML